ncbi:MAG: hypothetical protein JSU04_02895 [Bdellovibrionales bacterium]|nr:hypothetical protein [Bdellovibrionales bacterium]
MKKQFIVGMMIMTSVISFNAFAGSTAVRSPKEVVVDYMKQIEEFKASVKSGKVKASSLETAEALKQQDKTMDDLGLTNKEKNTLKSYISSGKAQKVDVISTLNVLLAAKNGTAGKTDAESVSIRNYVESATKLLTNMDLIGEKKSSTELSETEFKESGDALTKMIAILDKPLSYETAERDMFTASLNKLGEKAPTAESINSAFVQSIMASAKNADGKVGVSKDKAMEIIRKILKCV